MLLPNSKSWGVVAIASHTLTHNPLDARGFDPIPPRYATHLREIFEEIEGRTIANVSITVTVLE